MSAEPPINPYESPAFLVNTTSPGEASAGPPYQLYSQAGVAIASFLGSFAAGAVLLAINYFRLGKAGAAYGMLALGFVVQMATFALAMIMPDNAPSFLFVLGQTALGYGLAESLQGKLLSRHQTQGGRMASLWWAVGISLLVAIGVVALFIGVLLLAAVVLPPL